MPTAANKPRPTLTVDLRDALRRHGQAIVAMAFDASGERLAIASSPTMARKRAPMREGGYFKGAPRAGRVWVVKVPGGAVLHEFELPAMDAQWGEPLAAGLEMDARTHGDAVLTFSPDGAWLAVAWIAYLTPQLDHDCHAIAILDLARGEVANSGSGDASAWQRMTYREDDESGDSGLAAAFAPDGRLLVSACALWGEAPLTRCIHTKQWRKVNSDVEREPTTGARVAFASRGKRLVLADATGVAFADLRTGEDLGRSRGARQTRINGPLVVAPDGNSALTIGRVERGGRAEDGLWRWSPRTTPRLVAASPGDRDDGWDVLWIDRRGREVLWCDPDNALVRQHVADPDGAPGRRAPPPARLTRARPCPRARAHKQWQLVVAGPDGRRIARMKDGQVLLTRLRPRR